MSKIIVNASKFEDENLKEYKWLDECLQNNKSTVREYQSAWQAYKYMLFGKMYAYIGIDDRNSRPIITLKLEPILSEIMRKEYEDIVPGYYMNKIHWSSIYLDGDVSEDVIRDMAESSYKLMRASLSKKLQSQLDEM